MNFTASIRTNSGSQVYCLLNSNGSDAHYLMQLQALGATGYSPLLSKHAAWQVSARSATATTWRRLHTWPAASGFHSNVPNWYHSEQIKKKFKPVLAEMSINFLQRTAHVTVSDYCTVNVRHSNWVTQPKSVLDIRLLDVICKLPIQLTFAFLSYAFSEESFYVYVPFNCCLVGVAKRIEGCRGTCTGNWWRANAKANTQPWNKTTVRLGNVRTT